MHVSLPKELENLVKERVESGQYENASEVVKDALRIFFYISGENEIKDNEAVYIRKIVEPRLDALKKGKVVLHVFDKACEEINKEMSII